LLPFFFFVLCCGGDFATTSTARSKRFHASGSKSEGEFFFAEVMTGPPDQQEWLEAYYKKTDAYNLALGRFVSIFSMVECCLQTYLWHFAGISKPTAQAVFSGIRVDGAMQLINRIADAHNWHDPAKERIKYVFSQLGMINRLRNDILHYGAETPADLGGDWIVSNKQFAHIPERIQETKINPKILKDATYDLVRINLHVLTLTATGDERVTLEDALEPLFQSPWQ
jgi:hypothetical protein